jgi:hypothetical protein
MDKKYVSACGLTCCDCMFYKHEIYEAANNLKNIITETKINVFLSILSKEEFNAVMTNHLGVDKNDLYKYFQMFSKFQDFIEVLDGLIKIQCKNTCQETGGCSMCGTTKKCVTIKCVKDKGLNGCWECNETNSCKKLVFQKMSYGKTIDENFNIIKKDGIEFVPSRKDNYYEWQKRMKQLKKI